MTKLDKNVGGFLQQAFANNCAVHAYVVVGDKQNMPSLLKQCALVTMCHNHVGCNCEACNKVQNNTHQDVICVPQDREKNRLTVDDINLVVSESMKCTVDNSSCRVFLIDATNSLAGIGCETWQNKLLKTLEEPTEGIFLFVGVTDVEALLPTIRSRCQILKQSSFGVEQLQAHLASLGYNDKTAQIASAMAGGSLQTAESIASNSVLFDVFERALDMAQNMVSTKNAVKYVSQMMEYKQHVNQYLGFLCVLFRESVVYRLAPSLCLLPSLQQQIENICANYTLQAAQVCVEKLNQAKKRLDEQGNLAVVLDDLASSLLEVKFRCRT